MSRCGSKLVEEAKFDEKTGEALNAAAHQIVHKATATAATGHSAGGTYVPVTLDMSN
jgi:hypothetical protein